MTGTTINDERPAGRPGVVQTQAREADRRAAP